MSQDNPHPEDSQRKEIAGRSPAEWITFSIGSLILAIVIGLVSYDWMTQREEPPVLSVAPKGSIREHQEQFYVPFTVKNEGGKTAASVRVVAELKIAGEVEEIAELEIDFLSKQEIEEGAFVFTRNPKEGDLNMRVSSYKLP